MSTLFFDIEVDPTTDNLLLVGYALGGGPVHVLTLEWDGAGPGPQMEQFVELLADPQVPKVSHTAYDVRWFLCHGYTVAGPLHDTQVMAWVLNENTPLDLDWLVRRYTNVEMDKRLSRSAGRVWFRTSRDELVPLDEMVARRTDVLLWEEFVDYNRRDVVALRRLYVALSERLEESGWRDYWEREEVPYTAVLRRMETRGMPVDLDATRRLAVEVEGQKEEARLGLLSEAGLPPTFNLGSQQQLGAYLFSRRFFFVEELDWGPENCASLKACLAGDHEECDTEEGWHFPSLLPPNFVTDSVGRTVVRGHRALHGRGLEPTPPPVDKKTGKAGKLPSTSSPELLYMHAGDAWVRRLCTTYRKYEKLLNTYLEKFPKIAVTTASSVPSERRVERSRESGTSSLQPSPAVVTRIFGRFNQTGTVTGRLSSSEPNMQNMPARGPLGKKVRALFKGRLVVGDYDQVEMRLMAHFSRDPRMVEVFRQGRDPHVVTTQAVFGDVDPDVVGPGAAVSYRDVGKQLNYAMGYGAGRRKVAQTLSLFGFPTTPEVAAGYLAEMESFYRGYFTWKEVIAAAAKRRGSVSTLGGRRRRLRAQFRDTADWKLVHYGERQAVNAIIQGSAADVIRRGMVVADVRFPELRMLAQVHDEVVWEYEEGEVPSQVRLAALGRIMSEGHGFDLRVPLEFHPVVVDDWGQKSTGGADWWLAEREEEDSG